MNTSVLQSALNLRRAGRLAEAAKLYEQLLIAEPRNFDALHSLGIVKYQTGQIDEAVRLIGEAVDVRPEAHDAHYNRACLLQRLGRSEEALFSFDRAIELKSDYIEALANRAGLLSALQRHEEALASLDRVIALKPEIAEIWNNHAGVLIALNRGEEALASYDRAVALKPAYVDAWHTRGSLLLKLGRFEDALESFNKVLAINPVHGPALRSKADVLLSTKRSEEAAAAYKSYLAQKPGDADGWMHQGIALIELNRQTEALAAFDQAVTLEPFNADATNYRANVLFAMKRFDEAARDYARALQLEPDLQNAEGYLVQSRLRCCDWSRLEDDKAKIIAALKADRPVIDPFGYLSLSDSLADQLKCAQLAIAQSVPPDTPKIWQGERYQHDRIRVAYLSADFRAHPVAFLIAGVFEHHDKSRFELTAMSFGPDDNSEIRSRMAASFTRFIDVRDKQDIEVAIQLRQLEIDIAVDLTGFCDHGRPEILAFRPAPLQVNYLGYPGTLGADFIDYIIADRTLILPDEQQWFSENVVYMPDTYQANDRKRKIAARTPSRAEMGLPESGTVFCAFNNAYKITPQMFDIWMRLLSNIEQSVLWLLADNPVAVKNLKREAERRGVSGDRLIFAPRVQPEDHLARFQFADLFLDTLPYNAHTTASDSLWAGVPVVTCRGKTFAGRVATSLLKAAGLRQLVTESLQDYEALCLELGRDRDALAGLKEEIRSRRLACPLFDTPRMTRHLEAALSLMWLKHQRDEKPSSIVLEGELFR